MGGSLALMAVMETSRPIRAEISFDSAPWEAWVLRVNTALNTLSRQMSIGSSESSKYILIYYTGFQGLFLLQKTRFLRKNAA